MLNKLTNVFQLADLAKCMRSIFSIIHLIQHFILYAMSRCLEQMLDVLSAMV